MSYADLATEVIAKFVQEDEVPRDVLAGIVKRSCAAFRSEEVTPLVKVHGHYVLVSWNWYSWTDKPSRTGLIVHLKIHHGM